jgi:signal transduction histidine kinase
MKTRLCFSVLLTFAAASHAADEFASARDAEAIVGKAVKHIKAAGAQKAYEEFTNGKDWKDRDLYVVVYALDGKVMAHGQNPKMVGKDLIDMKDPDGKPFVRERVDLAKSKGKFWQDYKFTDPVTKKVLPKQMYCEKVDETAVCSGIYKRT